MTALLIRLLISEWRTEIDLNNGWKLPSRLSTWPLCKFPVKQNEIHSIKKRYTFVNKILVNNPRNVYVTAVFSNTMNEMCADKF